MIRSNFNTTDSIWVDQVETNPAVGIQKALIISAYFKYEMANISFDFVTDANAAVRTIYIQHQRSTYMPTIGASGYAHPASTTKHYCGFPGAPHDITGGGSVITFPIAKYPYVIPGELVNLMCNNIQVGDQLSNIRVTWKTWVAFNPP